MNLIRLRVTAPAKKFSIIEMGPNVVYISVKEPPVNNRANEAVISAAAKFYGIPENKLRMISGHQKPSKILRILD